MLAKQGIPESQIHGTPRFMQRKVSRRPLKSRPMQLVVAAVPYHQKTTAHAKARHRWAWASSRSIDIVDGEETSTRVASLA